MSEAKIPVQSKEALPQRRRGRDGLSVSIELGANYVVQTSAVLPPAVATPGGGTNLRGAKTAVQPSECLPPAEPNRKGDRRCVVSMEYMPPSDPIAGQNVHDPHHDHASTPEANPLGQPIGGQSGNETQLGTAAALPAQNREHLIAELVLLQKQRKFCIVSQSRCNRAIESLLASFLGYAPSKGDKDTKAGKAVFARAQAIRKAIEKGGTDPAIPDSIAMMVNFSAKSRALYDAHRDNTEKRMRKIVRDLPAYGFVQAVAGFGDLGFATILGETGDLSNYATKERVWKRCGLAVINGERQRRVADVEMAAEHGFNPKRRAEIWAIADSMFKHQWSGAKEDREACAKGRYGEVYSRRKSATEDRGWTPKHRDNDARRIMMKALLEELWRAWRIDGNS